MLRCVEQITFVCQLDDATQIHHCYAVSNVLDDRKIVADEQQRQAKFILEILQKVDNLSLDRNVECRDCFVTNDEIRFSRKCTGDADALALAAGEFMRQTCCSVFGQPHFIEKVCNACVNLLIARCKAKVAHWLSEYVTNPQAWIEAGEWILKYHLNATAQSAQLALGNVVDPFAVKDNFTIGNIEKP